MKLRMAEVGLFLDALGAQLQAGWTAMRERGLDVDMDATIEFTSDVVYDGAVLALSSSGSQDTDQTVTNIKPETTETTVQGAQVQTSADSGGTRTQNESAYVQTNTEDAAVETTVEAAATDLQQTVRTGSNTSSTGGGDVTTSDREYEFVTG